MQLIRTRPSDRDWYSVALTEQQVEYVKQHTDEGARDLIRLFKHWRDCIWRCGNGGHGGPSSYLLELAVANIYVKMKDENDGEQVSKSALATAVLNSLA